MVELERNQCSMLALTDTLPSCFTKATSRVYATDHAAIYIGY